jgi:hypothetical protein
VSELAVELAQRRTLVELVEHDATLDDVLTELWPRLVEVVTDVDALWSRA